MIRREDVVQIGKITKAHGLKGEVNFVFSDDVWDRADCDYLICDIDGILVPFYIEEYRFRNDSTALVKFDDIDSVETAAFLIGCNVFTEKKYIDEIDENDVPLSYFIGYKVIEVSDGSIVGTITDIDDSTENWLFILQQENGKEAMIPAHEDFIVEIKQDEKVIVVDLPIGLIEN